MVLISNLGRSGWFSLRGFLSGRTVPPVDAGCPAWAAGQPPSADARVHDPAAAPHLAHVRAVVVQAHLASQEDLKISRTFSVS